MIHIKLPFHASYRSFFNCKGISAQKHAGNLHTSDELIHKTAFIFGFSKERKYGFLGTTGNL